MALNVDVLKGLKPPTQPNLIGPYQSLAQLQDLQLQNQGMTAQIQDRQSQTQTRQASAQRGQAAAKVLQDHYAAGGDPDDPKLAQALMAVDPGIGEAYAKSRLEMKNVSSEISTREGTLAETKNRNVFEQKKFDAEESARKTEAARKAAEPIKVTPGEGLVKSGEQQPFYTQPFAPKTLTGNAAEYEYAKTQGYKGTFEQYQNEDANRKKSTTNITVGQLTDAGIDAAALNFAKTGIMPSLGMGSADLKTKIINRAAELMPGLDVASNKADFKANQDSLAQATKLKDALTSFESTAIKNMSILEGSAKKILDSGSPWLNKPLRGIDEKVLGNNELPIFRAARQIVVNEVAKLTNNPNLSGQLSDSARHEIESLLPAEMTLAQLLKLLPVLKQDMKNRTSSVDDQIQAIRKRIQGTGQSAPVATHRFNPATGQIEVIK